MVKKRSVFSGLGNLAELPLKSGRTSKPSDFEIKKNIPGRENGVSTWA